MIKILHNVATGKIEEIDLTQPELLKIEQDKQDYAVKQAEAEAKAVARTAILDRLGLTADEAAILLG